MNKACLQSHTKKKKKINIVKKIEKKLSLKYPDTDLHSDFLDYDFGVVSEKDQYDKKVIDMLPKLLDMKCNIEIESNKLEEKEEEKDEDHNITISDDEDELEVQVIGNKKYYLDYTKGNIYDLNKNSVGIIDDFGEIQIY